jgi:hypothetical protein
MDESVEIVAARSEPSSAVAEAFVVAAGGVLDGLVPAA